MNDKAHITANLFAFYHEVVRHGKLGHGTIAGIPWIENPAGGWPGYLLGGAKPDHEKVKEIADAMRDGRVPAFWIMESDPSGETEKVLSTYGIRMINYWTGMCLEAASLNAKKPSAGAKPPAANSQSSAPAAQSTGAEARSPASDAISATADDNRPSGSGGGLTSGSNMHLPADNKLEIRKIARKTEMDQWVALVNKVVMTSSQLDPHLFRNLMHSDAFYFYGLWHDNEILSTTLIFVHDQSGGLYFVATDEARQGKGYGTAISTFAMREVQKAGAKRFVLHATRQGLKLYQKTGFRKVNRYDIYWLLGKR